MRAARRWWFAVACAGAIGCTLLTPLDDLTSGSGSGGIDGGGDGGSSNDSGGDTGTGSETSVENDATTDSPASPTSCKNLSPAPTVCEDFDDPQIDFGVWNVATEGSGSKIEVVTSPFFSAPRAILSTTGPSSGSTRSAYVGRQLAGKASHVRVEYSIRRVQQGSVGFEVNMLRLLDNAGSASEFYLYVADDKSSYEQQKSGQPNVASPFAALPIGVWKRIRLDLELSGAPTFSVQVDGVEVASKPLTYPPINMAATNGYIGITYLNGGGAGGIVAFDDFVLDIKN